MQKTLATIVAMGLLALGLMALPAGAATPECDSAVRAYDEARLDFGEVQRGWLGVTRLKKELDSGEFQVTNTYERESSIAPDGKPWDRGVQDHAWDDVVKRFRHMEEACGGSTWGRWL